jgi:RNA polymerase sigma factor (sigma-70 family)
MEVATVTYKGSSARWRTPLLRLQPDERLIAAMRAGNHAAFDVLVARYQGRLLGFCERLLRSREDAEDILQEVFARAFTAILADDRPIHARPWLYRIARNRSLNHLRRTKTIGVDSIDDNQADHGQNAADKADRREDFRLLVGDINALPDSQRSALVLRELEALSYEQIADVMDKTIPSVKSLLVRARGSLAEAAQARALPCDDVELELQQLASGRRGTTPAARRHLRNCERCRRLQADLGKPNGRAALLPLGLLAVAKGVALRQLGRSTSAGATAGTTAPTVIAGSSAGGAISTGLGAAATKAAVGLAAATLGVAGAVAVDAGSRSHRARRAMPSVFAYDGRPQSPAVAGSATQPVADPRTTSPTTADQGTVNTEGSATTTTASPATATTPTTQPVTSQTQRQSDPASRSSTSTTAQTASAGGGSAATGSAATGSAATGSAPTSQTDTGSPAATPTDTAPTTTAAPATTPTAATTAP